MKDSWLQVQLPRKGPMRPKQEVKKTAVTHQGSAGITVSDSLVTRTMAEHTSSNHQSMLSF